MTIRTRFAPSPTGFLHIGGARTALYNWLFARQHKGKFLLRVEDTDEERSSDDSVSQILSSMKWLGLEADEKPIFQSSRKELYKKYIIDLLSSDKAYKCFCSKEELENSRIEQKSKGLKPRFCDKCRDGSHQGIDDNYVVRFRNPRAGTTNFLDLVKGKIEIKNSELDDLIIQRSDGTPTYNFVVVIDDNEMRITHVIRGDDHINNTPKQINIMQAFGFKVPEYAHLPMIMGDDGTRLSKRHGAGSVLEYRDKGFLSRGLLNYLARLGWSHGDEEIFSIEDLISNFSLSRVNQSSACFDHKKLLWVNQHWLNKIPVEDVAILLEPYLARFGMEKSHKNYLPHIVNTMKARSSTLVEMSEKSKFIFKRPISYEEKAQDKFFDNNILDIFNNTMNALLDLKVWSNESIQEVVKLVSEDMGLKLIFVAQPIRIAMTGNVISPGIGETLFLIGKEESIERLKNIISYLNKKS
mgnify:CR=1 FL=1